MKKGLVFLDELYYKKDKDKYYSKFNAGNFLKDLSNEYKLDYIVPVAENNDLDERFELTVIGDEIGVLELPEWDSLIGYIKKHNYNKKKIKCLIEKNIDNYDFFWIRLPSMAGVVIGEELKKRGKKVIYHLAGDIRDAYNTGKYSGVKKYLAYYLGENLNKKMHKLYDKNNSFYLCTGSNLMEEFKECKPTFFIDNEYKVEEDLLIEKKPLKNVIYVGRLIEKKGVKYILDAWKQLPEDIVLNIVGNGDLEETVKDYENRYSNIKYHGFLHGEELEKMYNKSDCLIMASILTEGFPRVICEAWSKGVGVISTNVGGISYLGEENKNIVYVKSKDSEDISSKVLNLFNDEEKLLEIRKGGIESAKQIEKTKMYEKIKQIIDGDAKWE